MKGIKPWPLSYSLASHRGLPCRFPCFVSSTAKRQTIMKNELIRPEQSHSINGVSGRLQNLRVPPAPWVSGVFANQTWISEARPVTGYGRAADLHVEMSFDDNCRNGHMSFAITGDIREKLTRRDIAGGCLHDDIARTFPELAHLIKWHLCATDGPMHYIANTVYLAGDRDCNGLKKGEKRQIKNGRSGAPCWELVASINGEQRPVRELKNHLDAEECPEAPTVFYAPWCRIGEGKERQLDAARSAAIWPEATDEQLSAEPAELRAMLAARLPALLADFRADMERIGFLWQAPARDEV